MTTITVGIFLAPFPRPAIPGSLPLSSTLRRADRAPPVPCPESLGTWLHWSGGQAVPGTKTSSLENARCMQIYPLVGISNRKSKRVE
jgi:hypothetical protein